MKEFILIVLIEILIIFGILLTIFENKTPFKKRNKTTNLKALFIRFFGLVLVAIGLIYGYIQSYNLWLIILFAIMLALVLTFLARKKLTFYVVQSKKQHDDLFMIAFAFDRNKVQTYSINSKHSDLLIKYIGEEGIHIITKKYKSISLANKAINKVEILLSEKTS